MALADYFLCDVCERKTFYDAGLHYDEGWPHWRKNDSHPLPRGAADMAVLCPDCAKTHEVRVLARDAENQEP